MNEADLLAAVREINEVSHEFNRELGSLDARTSAIEKNVEKILRLLSDDNVALLPRVSVLERDMTNLKAQVAEMGARKDASDDDSSSALERVKLAEAEAKREFGAALKAWGPAIGAVVAALAAAAAWLKGVVSH